MQNIARLKQTKVVTALVVSVIANLVFAGKEVLSLMDHAVSTSYTIICKNEYNTEKHGLLAKINLQNDVIENANGELGDILARVAYPEKQDDAERARKRITAARNSVTISLARLSIIEDKITCN